jgi:hypothetical protein
MKMSKWLVMASVAAAMCLSSNYATAQGFGGRGNFDPAQMRQRMMDRYKEALEVNNDDDWKAIQPLVENVMQARMEVMRAGGGMGGMGRMFARRRNTQQGGQQAGNQPQRRFGPPPSPEAEALQKAIDAKAPAAELKASMIKFVLARKAKQAELEKAQEDLRKVLTPRQEAIATLDGLL